MVRRSALAGEDAVGTPPPGQVVHYTWMGPRTVLVACDGGS
jgi:hypothetical protein